MSRLFPPDSETIKLIDQQLEHLRKIGNPAFAISPLLSREQLSALTETAFWASLRSEEGRPTRLFIVIADPGKLSGTTIFAQHVPYDEGHIVKLAQAVASDDSLIVSVINGELRIVGFCRGRSSPGLDAITLEISDVGSIRVGVGPYKAFAVLDGRTDTSVEGTSISFAAQIQKALKKKLPSDDMLETQAAWRECLLIATLARHVLTAHHGGAILIVPDDHGSHLASLNPFEYRLDSTDSRIPDAVRRELRISQKQAEAIQKVFESSLPDEIKTAVSEATMNRPWYIDQDLRSVAALANVDGAVVITERLQVIGFGAKIVFAGSDSPSICLFRAKPGLQPVENSPLNSVGGMRHQSAARFVAMHPECVAIVISQDGSVSLISWSEELKSVAVVRNAEWWL